MFRYFKSLPTQLILSIVAAFILGGIWDISVVTWFYTGSSCFIELLLFILPFMVFSFIFLAITRIKHKSLQLIAVIFLGVFLSNSLALFTAYSFSSLILPSLGIAYTPELFTKFSSPIEPLFKLHLPALLSTDKAMILGVAAGLLTSVMPEESKIKQATFAGVSRLSQFITFFLHKIFIPLLPIYVFGFCLKLSYDQALTTLLESYGKVFILSMLLVAAYLFVLYFTAARGSLKMTFSYLKAMAPAGLTGFSTMSSAATMPVTLQCTEKTTKDRHFTDLIIPTTSNIHMLGDDLTIVMTAMALLPMFGFPLPDVTSFALFAAAFCVAKLSCVGIPGASVLVILPVLQNFLNFTPEMITVLTTIYVLQDPFGTAANVMGNGAFALVVQRFFSTEQRRVSSRVE